jgi:hypothetical protein
LDHFQQFCRLAFLPGRRHHGMRPWRREPGSLNQDFQEV